MAQLISLLRNFTIKLLTNLSVTGVFTYMGVVQMTEKTISTKNVMDVWIPT